MASDDLTDALPVVRTPDECFEGLADWPYEPRYVTIGEGLRVHYVDEGDPAGPLVVLNHGEPTWSYLYRKMIPGLVDAGCRVIAHDLVGFGRSDKLTERDEYTYGRHVRWIGQTLDAVGATSDVHLFCQDWGGLAGLVEVARNPSRYRSVVCAASGVPLGVDIPMPDDAPFARWRRHSQEVDDFRAGAIVGSTLDGVDRQLSEAEMAAYDAPFPELLYQAGPRQFPLLVPLRHEHPGAWLCRDAWNRLADLDVPMGLLYGDRDGVTGPLRPLMQSLDCTTGQPDRIVEGAGHFIQEDAPDACVEITLEMISRTT